jgi:DNA-binding Lrp family transcriptional regulator
MVSAIVLIGTQIGAVNEVASELVKLKGVREIYSVAGSYDLVALVFVRDHDDLAELVSNQIRKQTGILTTRTLIAFRVYTAAELGAANSWGIQG